MVMMKVWDDEWIRTLPLPTLSDYVGLCRRQRDKTSIQARRCLRLTLELERRQRERDTGSPPLRSEPQ